MRGMRTASRGLRALAVGVALAGGLVGPAAGAAPLGGFTIRPAHFDAADPATRAYFKPVVAAGGAFSDQVIVGNTGDAPIDLLVYPVDGLTAVTSGAVYANRERPAVKAARWVRVAVATLSVAPHTETAVGFTVQVPPGAAAGDHLAGIAFEDAHPQESGSRFSVTEVIRGVMGVQVQVPGPGKFHVHVDGVDLTPRAGVGTGAAVVRVGNDGSRLGKPQLCVSLSGPHGYRRAVRAQLDTILPGDTIPFPLSWPDTLERGDYGVSVAATCGASSVLFRADLHLGTTLKPPGHAGRTKASAGQFPWLIIIATALGGVLAGAILVRRPRRPSKLPRPGSVEVIGEIPSTAPAARTRGPAA
jgi:hypothetical protein